MLWVSRCKMTNLFEITKINNMTLANRFVRSATWEGMAADDGAATPGLINLMTDLAGGGVGLIISSHAYVTKEGQAGPWQLGVYADDLVPGLRKMTAAVHDGGGRIVIQLAHAGYHANGKLSGMMPVAPSTNEGPDKSPRKALTEEGIQGIVEAFAEAAGRAREAGFDGVQIHAAHGYLLSQFLSPIYNHRTDAYGGDIQNRSKMLMAVLKAIRDSVGPDYPVLTKMNCGDFLENGLEPEDAIQVGKMLAEAGIDAVELSGGLLTGGKMSPSRMGIHSMEKEAYFQKEALEFRKNVQVPLILVGGNRSYETAQKIVDNGIADYISMCRPFIREPGLIKRWQSGDLTRSACLSDNKCFGPIRAGKGLYCVMDEDLRSRE
jgi:2,4-dienoyl-CoA reductase-like NADH-dependent reductase (Old Yellow Enzyme family)